MRYLHICTYPHLLFSFGVAKKAKVISEKTVFFVNINSWNQYNYFLKIEHHQICTHRNNFSIKLEQNFKKILISWKTYHWHKKIADIGKIWTMDKPFSKFFKSFYLYKPLYQVSSQLDVYFKSQDSMAFLLPSLNVGAQGLKP